MNKNILTAAASKTWLFALLLIIFGALWILPFMTVIPFLGDLIYGAIFMSLAFMAIYMRDAAYAFEGDERVALKDVAMGFGLMLMGLIVEDFGSFAIAIVWDLAFGVLFLLGGLKIMGAFGKLKESSLFDQNAAGTLKLAGIFFLVAGVLGILYAIPVLSIVFWILFKIFLLVAAIMFLVGIGKIKNA